MAASPSTGTIMADHELNRRLFNALKGENAQEVIHLCENAPDGPLHVTGIHKDTVLHLACYSKRKDLAVRLVRILPDNLNRRLTEVKNDVGNTVLHEAATSNVMSDVATLLLAMEPKLLSATNAQGETPLFRAARFGKIHMFNLLAGKVDKLDNEERRREQLRSGDKTSILHIAVIAEHFELAMMIVKRYPDLIGMKDGNDMTALQHLACNPSAFGDGSQYGLFKKLIYQCIPVKKRTMEEEDLSQYDTKREDTQRCVKWLLKLLMWKELKREKYKQASAWELAKVLIKKDTSWEATEKTALNKGKNIDDQEKNIIACSQQHLEEIKQEGQFMRDVEKNTETTMTGMISRDETPLFMATSWRITKLVKKILKTYPQAVEHVNKKGRNILHVAIQFRQFEIFEKVIKNEMLARRLLRATDAKGNSLLHMVAKNRKGPKMESSLGPALDLQDQLLHFEKVKVLVKSDFVRLFNHKNQTAEELFAKNYSKLHQESRKWLEETSKNCTIVAVLIATVAFAAAYTVPGGNQSSGMPVLLSQPFFVVFTLSDVISLSLALTSVISFLSILTWPFQLQDFQQSLPQKLTLALTFLILSVTMMMIAFAATIILMIHYKKNWTEIALSSAAFFPVLVFAYSYSPLYVRLVKACSYLSHVVKKICAARRKARNRRNRNDQHPPDRSQRSSPQITEV